jgi:hypothetical protein
MKPAEMLPLLQEWAKRHEALRAQMDALQAALGNAVDGPLGIAVWNVADAYTNTLSALIGDRLLWLDWYATQNDMGRAGLTISVSGSRARKVRNLRQLARVVEECAGAA